MSREDEIKALDPENDDDSGYWRPLLGAHLLTPLVPAFFRSGDLDLAFGMVIAMIFPYLFSFCRAIVFKWPPSKILIPILFTIASALSYVSFLEYGRPYLLVELKAFDLTWIFCCGLIFMCITYSIYKASKEIEWQK